MTRLTVANKDGIAYSIIADLPKNPFDEKITALLIDAANEKLPKNARQIDTEYLNRERFWFGGFSMMLPAPIYMSNCGSSSWEKYFGEKWPEIEQMCNARKKWNDDRDILKRQIKANIQSCSTVKQFSDRFPDLVKYLPSRKEDVANLPATNDFMDRLKTEGLKL